MLINCPNCNASYEVNPDIIPTSGRKLRCSSCHEVFWCNPHDEEKPAQKLEDVEVKAEKESPKEEVSVANNEAEEKIDTISESSEEAQTIESETIQPENEIMDDEDIVSDDVNMQDIFQRLSLESDEISNAEQKMGFVKKIINKISLTLGWHKKTNRTIVYSIVGLFALLWLLYFRVEITRKLPFMNLIYATIGMDAVIPGEGLEFRNVTRREYEFDDIPQMEIRGFIDNPTDREISADLLHVEVLDTNGNVLQQQNDPMPVPYLTPKARVPFSVIVVKPSSLGKYIVVTFAKNED